MGNTPSTTENSIGFYESNAVSAVEIVDEYDRFFTPAATPVRANSDAGCLAEDLSTEGLLAENSPAEDPSQRTIRDDSPPRHVNQTRARSSPKAVSYLSERGTGSHRAVISIDYGETFTGVAFAITRSDIAQLEEIRVIQDWGPRMRNHLKIPNVYSYSPAPAGEEQWGADISPNATTVMSTRLELELQNKRIDELSLTLQVLEGVNGLSFKHIQESGGFPDYPCKGPADIIKDYFTKVFERVYDVMDLRGLARSKIPLDIVVTVPVNWSYEATNATLRSLMSAGFNIESFPTLNDMILVTEPEAAAYFTARRLKEDRKKSSLKQHECFILCDAGGSTVNTISYQIVKLKPQLELEQITLPTSDTCGSTHVNVNFKRWLRKSIGERHYYPLNSRGSGLHIDSPTVEGGRMRELIAQFDTHKKTFSNSTDAINLRLPPPLDRLCIPGILPTEGDLVIQPKEMKSMLDPCVNSIIELIDGQRRQIEMQNRYVKNVLLVGGFGESPYLQEELQNSLELRRIMMPRPDPGQPWTAVVQGGVMYGIEKAHHPNLRLMSTSPKSYGIVIDQIASSHMSGRQGLYTGLLSQIPEIRKQLVWMIRKGDLIFSDKNEAVEKEFTYIFRTPGQWQFELPVYVYPDEDDDIPDKWETGQREVTQIGAVECDLSHPPIHRFQLHRMNALEGMYHVGFLICRMQNSLSGLEVEVCMDTIRIGYKRIPTRDSPLRLNSSNSLYS